MTREISRWGVGPSIVVSAGAYAAVAGLATWLWPNVCLVRVVPNTVFLIAGIVLLVIGVPMLLVAARAATIGYNSDKFATNGIFGLTRNPIYSAWIVFIIPGLVLMSRSWPLFLTPVMAYIIFKARIGRENEYLEKRFGEEYRKYKAEVNELIPCWSRRASHDPPLYRLRLQHSVLIPVAFQTLLSGEAGNRRVFEGKFSDSEGLRTILGSLWMAILVASCLGLLYPVQMSPVLIVQIIYKSLWMLVFVLPRLTSGRRTEIPWGLTLTFLVIVLAYPWIVPWSHLFAAGQSNRRDRWPFTLPNRQQSKPQASRPS